MNLGFLPKDNIAEPQALTNISDAIEKVYIAQKQQTQTTARVGSELLASLQTAAELTQNYDTVDIEDINSEITLVLLRARFYKENLEKDKTLIDDLKLKIQLANSRDWYRKFILERTNAKDDIAKSAVPSGAKAN